MRIKKFVFLLLSTAAAAVLFGQADFRLLDKGVYRALRDEISGVRAMDYIRGISRFNRTDGAFEGTGYEKAVSYVMDILEESGVAEIKLHTYLSDGVESYGSWRSNPGFRIHSARLYLIKPSRSKWCDTSETTVALMPYSNGQGVEEAEVVFVGKGASDKDYEGREVEGKIVFAEHGDAAAVMRQAVQKRGAAGIVMGSSSKKSLVEFPSLVEVNRLYLSGEETRNSKWGFSLSRVQTETLKNLLESERKVVMRAEVHAETFSGHMPVISAVIKGSEYPDQEIIYMAHLDHYKPGANDNASGCAGLVELASTFTRLIGEGRIPRPLRTIRFLWVPEWEGTAAYIEKNADTVQKGVIGINMDMIGANLQNSQSFLSISRTPLSGPSFLDALVEYYTDYVDRMRITTEMGSNSTFNYRVVDYMGGSDHMMFCDAQIGVPSMMMCNIGDRFWHTSFDVPENIDPTEMERSILLAAFVGWTAASYGEQILGVLSELTLHSLIGRIESRALEYSARLHRSGEKKLHRMHGNIQSYYDFLYDYGSGCFAAISDNLPADKTPSSGFHEEKEILKRYVDLQRKRTECVYRTLCRMKETEPRKAELSAMETECSRIFPKRLTSQSLSFRIVREVLRDNGIFPFLSYDMVWEMMNFADGGHNLLQIRNAMCAQFREVGIKPVKVVFDALKEQGWIGY